jgi:hypothetical protein
MRLEKFAEEDEWKHGRVMKRETHKYFMGLAQM